MITDFCKTDVKKQCTVLLRYFNVVVVVEWYDRFCSIAMITKTDWNELNLFLKFTT